MAECSLSTGKIRTPCFLARGIMICPAVTRVSLLARAMSFPASMAAMVGRIPIMPTMAVTRICDSGCTATRSRPSMPKTISNDKSAVMTASSFAFSCVATHTRVG